jgi:hypothetical protein
MTVKDLHKEAMRYNDLALIAKKDNSFLANEYFLKAFEFEKQAYILFSSQSLEEPTRSILLRSTANLAYHAGKLAEAEKFVALALSGNPPANIADELRDLFQQINFYRHLSLNGYQLSNNELQLSLSGNDVGHGIIRKSEFTTRIDVLEKLSYRTADRLRNKPFQENGSKKKSQIIELDAFLSVPRAASFAVTVKFGEPTKEPSFLGMESQIPLVDDIFKNLSLVNDNNEEALQDNIPDEAYRNNFIGLSKQLLPDGDKVNLVGLTIIRNNKEVTLPITRTKSNLSFNIEKINIKDTDKHIDQPIELRGILTFADSQKNAIKLTDSDNKEYKIIVPKGLMSDVVKPFFEEEVVISGIKTVNGVIFSGINI